MVQLSSFPRSFRLVLLAFCSVSVVATTTPASARPHHRARHHAGAHHHHHHFTERHRARHLARAGFESPATAGFGYQPQAAAGDGSADLSRARRFANANASMAPASATFGSSDVVSEARRYLGGNPTGRGRLWCARFMNMVLQRSGHRGTGSDMARSFASYGQRLSGPQIGAIAVMGRRGGGHVGVVSGIDASGNPIVVSGNSGGRVREAAYPRSRIQAYVMPSS